MKSFSFSVFCFILLLADFYYLPAQTNVPGGMVSGVWTASQSPFYVQGNIQIAPGTSLTIEPGVEVYFQGYYRFQVLGKLIAKGTPSDSIVFTAADTTGHSDISTIQGGWKGIYFDHANADSSFIEYASISYFKDTVRKGYTYPPPAAVATYYTDKLQVSHSQIHHCLSGKTGNAIYTELSRAFFTQNHIFDCVVDTSVDQPGAVVTLGSSNDIEFSNNEISNCLGGYNLFVSGSYNADIHHNYLHHNYAFWRGGGMFAIGAGPSYGNIFIHHNTVTQNQSYITAGGIAIQGMTAYMDANLIANNFCFNQPNWACPIGSGGGGVNVQLCVLYMFNNVIVNNSSSSYGGGVVTTDSYLNIINNTIANNQCGLAGIGTGGGIYTYVDFFTYPDIQTYPNQLSNNILHGNRDTIPSLNIEDQVRVDGVYYSIMAENNQIETTSLLNLPNFLNTISLNPEFALPSLGTGYLYNGFNANWRLKNISPCIDTGNPDTTGYSLPAYDFGGNNRIISDTIDRGAMEFRQEQVGIIKPQMIEFSIFPNPAKTVLNILIPQNHKEKTALIYDISGKHLVTFSVKNELSQWDVSSLANGIYFISIEGRMVKWVKE